MSFVSFLRRFLMIRLNFFNIPNWGEIINSFNLNC